MLGDRPASRVGDKTFWISVTIGLLPFVALFVWWGTISYGCGPTFAWSSINAADAAALQKALSRDKRTPRFEVVSVGGHTAYVVDDSCAVGTCMEQYDRDQRRFGALIDVWLETYRTRHPHAFHNDRIMIQVRDTAGNDVLGVSVPECAMP